MLTVPVVVVDPNSWYSGSELDSRCQMITSRTDGPAATIAFFFPRRLAIVRYLAPRKVSIWPQITAA